MFKSSRLFVCCSALLMAPAVFAAVAFAAEPAPAEPSPHGPSAPPPVQPDLPNAPVAPGNPGRPGLANAPLPSTPAERTKLLSNLYAYLATAEDDKQAAPIAQAIERLWLFADSDTIGVLMDRGAKAIADKDYDLGLRFMDAVVDLAPDYAEGWNRRAYVHFLRNDVERMVGDLRRCLALEPNHFRALEGLAQVMRETGQKKAALKAYERLLEVHPNTPGLQDAIKELSRDVDGQKT